MADSDFKQVPSSLWCPSAWMFCWPFFQDTSQTNALFLYTHNYTQTLYLFAFWRDAQWEAAAFINYS